MGGLMSLQGAQRTSGETICMVFDRHGRGDFHPSSSSKQAAINRQAVDFKRKGEPCSTQGVYSMQNEQWIADRALLQRSLHDHPEWGSQHFSLPKSPLSHSLY